MNKISQNKFTYDREIKFNGKPLQKYIIYIQKNQKRSI